VSKKSGNHTVVAKFERDPGTAVSGQRQWLTVTEYERTDKKCKLDGVIAHVVAIEYSSSS
jgi:hypothetical protein